MADVAVHKLWTVGSEDVDDQDVTVRYGMKFFASRTGAIKIPAAVAWTTSAF